MTIRFACRCGRQLALRDQAAGKKGKCPGCGTILTVPAPSGDGTAASPSASDQTPATCSKCGGPMVEDQCADFKRIEGIAEDGGMYLASIERSPYQETITTYSFKPEERDATDASHGPCFFCGAFAGANSAARVLMHWSLRDQVLKQNLPIGALVALASVDTGKFLRVRVPRCGPCRTHHHHVRRVRFAVRLLGVMFVLGAVAAFFLVDQTLKTPATVCLAGAGVVLYAAAWLCCLPPTVRPLDTALTHPDVHVMERHGWSIMGVMKKL